MATDRECAVVVHHHSTLDKIGIIVIRYRQSHQNKIYLEPWSRGKTKYNPKHRKLDDSILENFKQTLHLFFPLLCKVLPVLDLY